MNQRCIVFCRQHRNRVPSQSTSRHTHLPFCPTEGKTHSLPSFISQCFPRPSHSRKSFHLTPRTCLLWCECACVSSQDIQTGKTGVEATGAVLQLGVNRGGECSSGEGSHSLICFVCPELHKLLSENKTKQNKQI